MRSISAWPTLLVALTGSAVRTAIRRGTLKPVSIRAACDRSSRSLTRMLGARTTAAATSSPSVGMRDREHARLRHCRMPEQHAFDFARSDLLAAAIDDILDPSAQRQIAVAIEPTQVAGAKPAVDERGRGGHRIVEVPVDDAGAARDDLAERAFGHCVARRVDDRNVVEHGGPDGARPANVRWQRVTRQRARLRHAVALEHRCAERVLESGHHLRIEARRTRPNEAKPCTANGVAIPVEALQDRLMDRRSGGIPRRVHFGHLPQERPDVEFARTDHARAVGERNEQRGFQAVPVEHRHHVQAAVARAELVELAARTRVREQMALADRHELLLRRRARRQQHERHVVVRIPRRIERGRASHDGEARSAWRRRARPQPDRRSESRARRRCARGGIVRGDDQGDGPKLREIAREFGFRISGVQRDVDRAARYSQEADRRVGATRQRACNAIAAADAVVCAKLSADVAKPRRQDRRSAAARDRARAAPRDVACSPATALRTSKAAKGAANRMGFVSSCTWTLAS